MDYYEEFGVSRTATTEEIRQAHKRLARLFHPDRHREQDLHHLAECQMKRLNAIYGVLSDPAKRLEYDRLLVQSTGERLSPPKPRGTTRASCRNAAWAVAGLAAGLILQAVFSANHSRPRPPSAPLEGVEEPAAPAKPTPAGSLQSPAKRYSRIKPGEIRNDQPGTEIVRSHPATGGTENPAGAREADGAMLVEPVEPFALAQADVHPSGPVRDSAPAQTSFSGTALAGSWFYLPEAGAQKVRGIYPPEYIDLAIAEEHGLLRGRYWARYRVPDRAISPEVFFRFEGKVNEDGAYSWIGRGGARGEVRLKLLSEHNLQVVWLASELGRQLGLGSGQAVLVRQQRP